MRSSQRLLALIILNAVACASEVDGPVQRAGDRTGQNYVPDAAPVLALAHATFVLDEGTPMDGFTVVSDRSLSNDVVVALSYSGTFSADDFLLLPESIVLPAGATSASVGLVLGGDTRVEEYKTLVVALTTSAAVTLASASYTFEVIDDDAMSIVVGPYYDAGALADDYTTEGVATPTRRTFRYSAPGGISDPFDPPVAANAGGLGGVDFDVKLELVDMVGTLGKEDILEDLEHIVLPAHEVDYTWSVTARQDAIPEGVEHALLRYRVTNVTTMPSRDGYDLIEIDLRVLDDEVVSVLLKRTGTCAGWSDLVEEQSPACTLRVERTGDTSLPLDVSLAYSGAATLGSDFTGPSHVAFAPGAASATFDIAVVDDAALEPREDLIVRLAEASGFSCFCSEGLTYTIAQSDLSPDGRSVEITGDASGSAVVLDWSNDLPTYVFTVYRRTLGEMSWGSARATVPVGTLTYTDSDVVAGTTYEYKVERSTGMGFAAVAYRQPAKHYRGRVLLVAEATVAAQLGDELGWWEDQLVGEGWDVVYETVAASDTPVAVKQIITAHYAEPNALAAIVLFGHVPPPYSGALAPDGHGDHSGAWPADGYYGDMDGVWTDTTVNLATASRPENRNVPGDGKFDQSTYPSAIEVAVGRIDMHAMTDFAPLTEVDLLRRYLHKMTSYRHAEFVPTRRALVDDNFGDFGGEAFSRAAWNWFGNIVGRSQTFGNDWLTELSTNDYLWAYGCGGGGYDRAGGIGTTADFADTSFKVVFTSLFGSYFGDWDASNNFLRAVLAADGHALTTVWSGRPNWTFHALAAGEPMTTSILSTWNNTTYFTHSADRGVHTGFLGDPTLRDYMHPPVASLALSDAGDTVELTWDADLESTGYFVYGSTDRHHGYVLLTPTAIADTSITLTPQGDQRYFMVRSRRSLDTLGGSFESLSGGSIVVLP